MKPADLGFTSDLEMIVEKSLKLLTSSHEEEDEAKADDIAM